MQVILTKEVSNLGGPGDIVKVSAGYGRNFLLPRGLAILANASSVNQLEHEKQVADAIRRKELSGAQAAAEKLENISVSIKREAGEEDKLFGSVTNRDIAEALAAEGVEIDRRTLQLEEPIRAIGLYQVPVRLHRDVTATIRVYVIRA